MCEVPGSQLNVDDNVEEVADLELESIIGFDGNTINGLQVHPDNIHVVYPLGMKVTIQNWKTKKQYFLCGHSNAISTLAISANGKYIASGQINHMGFKASMIIWDFEKRAQIAKHEIHKVRVESVVFSCDARYLVSLGGRDDGNVVVWDILNEEAMCGFTASPATAGDATVLCATNVRGPCFLSGGGGTLRTWRINPAGRNVRAAEVAFGTIKRIVTCIVIDVRDLHAFCGTTTGDIAKVRLNYDHDPEVIDPVSSPVLIGCFGKFTGKKAQTDGSFTQRWSRGVTALCLLPDELEDLLCVGSGDGVVELVRERNAAVGQADGKLRSPSEPQFVSVNSAQVCSEVTSLHLMGDFVIVGTAQCEIYTIDVASFAVTLHVTCHTRMIHDIAFPSLYPEVFATCDYQDIRVWDSDSGLELLRITVPNFTCTSIIFASDGKSIISGWNDGEIRAFTPQTGRLMYTILNAHNRGVTAVAVTSDGRRIISGGGEGQVRVWDVKPDRQQLLAVLKEHKGPVSHICMAQSDDEAVSSSSDGTCIIWDIKLMTRKQVLFANTQFTSVVYHPSDVQILTCGSDRKVGYWESFDGSLIRELEGSTAAALNGIDVTRDGNYFATVGCDMYLKVWKYKDGIAVNYGVGHAATICCVRFSPDGKFIISASADGAIFRWKCPYALEATDDPADDSNSSRSTCSGREGRGRGGEDGEENASKCSSALLEAVKQSTMRVECRCGEAGDGAATKHWAGCPAVGRMSSKGGSVSSKSSSKSSSRGRLSQGSRNSRQANGIIKKN